MHLSTAYKLAYFFATVDFICATICAVHGDWFFIPFLVLSWLMWSCGMYLRTRANEKIGE
jgi:hypothetical protein